MTSRDISLAQVPTGRDAQRDAVRPPAPARGRPRGRRPRRGSRVRRRWRARRAAPRAVDARVRRVAARRRFSPASAPIVPRNGLQRRSHAFGRCPSPLKTRRWSPLRPSLTRRFDDFGHFASQVQGVARRRVRRHGPRPRQVRAAARRARARALPGRSRARVRRVRRDVSPRRVPRAPSAAAALTPSPRATRRLSVPPSV